MSAASHEQRRAERLLDSRARVLARRRAPVRDASAVRVLALALGSDLYAIPLGQAQRVTRFSGCTPIPGGAAVRGIIALHGRIYTVLELSTLLGMPVPDDAGDGHLVLLRSPRPRLALRCTRVLGAIDLMPIADAAPEPDSPPGRAAHGRVPDDSADLAGATLALIDLDRLLAPFRAVKQELPS